ncbi:MAG: hypothetical protein WC992_08295 [Acholeplasmataceae bacterium]
MVVEMLNLYYFIYIGFAIILTWVALKFLNHKSEKFRYWFIYGLILFNLLIHFAKTLIYPYTTIPFPAIFTKVSFENICAVSALLFPILYFAKSKTLKDYMVMVGVASGIITFIYPIDAMSDMFNAVYVGVKPAFHIEVIRFYLSHFLIFLAPFLMLHYRIHELSIKRVYKAPFMLLLILVIIFINEVIVTLIGWVPKSQMFDPAHRNPSFIFGVGARNDLTGLGMILGVLVPGFFRTNPFFAGDAFFPVLWLLFPSLIYGSIIAMIFMLIYDRDETLKFLKLRPRIKETEESQKII